MYIGLPVGLEPGKQQRAGQDGHYFLTLQIGYALRIYSCSTFKVGKEAIATGEPLTFSITKDFIRYSLLCLS